MSRCKSNLKVVSYRLNGKKYKVYDSAKKAALLRHAHPRTIDKCIRGDTLTAYGYMWRRYPEDNIPEQIEPYIKKECSTKKVPIIEIDTSNNVIAEYSSIKEASRTLHIDPHSIRDNLNGKSKQACGHLFKYENR